ncbi:hypothetical protein HII30_06490 [Paenibacillus lemnae]|uniref:Uncharacterized protein n=1 Tax=Paenibacillus lemnae TaxID=1330551 RepID=A0A848M6G8_PAELE|nr:hypothetical protein [Paenibacillus lemnae]
MNNTRDVFVWFPPSYDDEVNFHGGPGYLSSGIKKSARLFQAGPHGENLPYRVIKWDQDMKLECSVKGWSS